MLLFCFALIKKIESIGQSKYFSKTLIGHFRNALLSPELIGNAIGITFWDGLLKELYTKSSCQFAWAGYAL